MRRVRSLYELQTFLDGSFSWRLHELSAIKRAVSTSSGPTQTSLLRAGVPILYAHWEGFIKEAAGIYGAYLSRLGIPYSDVKECLWGIAAIEEVRRLETIKKKVFAASKAVSSIISIGNAKLRIPMDEYVSNVGNLNFELFEGFLEFFGIDPQPYELKRNLIDVSLLKARNTIAHGEYISIDSSDFLRLSDEVFELMRHFKTEIENGASSKSYLRVPAA